MNQPCMAIKFVFYCILNSITIIAIQAQVIEKNVVAIGVGYGYNIFESPKYPSYQNNLIQNDFYQVFENEFELSKKIKQTKHHISLKTTWYTFNNYRTLNKSNVKLQYLLKHRLSKKLMLNFRATYFKNKTYRTNILGERLKYAHHYQTLSFKPQLNYTLNNKCKFKLTYLYAPYFYFKDGMDYNYHKNEFSAEAAVALNHIGYTKKKLKFLLDVSNRNYLYKISRNRLGKRSDDSNLWNWMYYSASINFFEEVDYNRNMRIAYLITWKDDSFEGYYNYVQHNILFNYIYDFNGLNSLILSTDFGFRKYKHRQSVDEQQLRYFYPEVSLEYHRKLKEQFKFITTLQTYSRSANFEDIQSLTKRNYFNLFIEAALSYNFVKVD